MKCEDCGQELTAMNPPCEEYLEPKFCLKLFGYKLMLIKDVIDYDCMDCLVDRQRELEAERLNQTMRAIAEKKEDEERDNF
jgi:hypothetical protein